MEQFGDNVISVIRMEDPMEHTPRKPFCWDETCPCHEDQDAIAQVAQCVLEGIMTPEEATNFVRGRGI